MVLHKRDSNGDWMPMVSLGDGITKSEAVARLIEDRLRIFQGEWWENASIGNPALEMLRMFRPTEANQTQLINAITAYIQETEGVIAVEDVFGLMINGRIPYGCIVQTVYGKAEINTELRGI